VVVSDIPFMPSLRIPVDCRVQCRMECNFYDADPFMICCQGGCVKQSSCVYPHPYPTGYEAIQLAPNEAMDEKIVIRDYAMMTTSPITPCLECSLSCGKNEKCCNGQCVSADLVDDCYLGN
jgi:hypothetical protein